VRADAECPTAIIFMPDIKPLLGLFSVLLYAACIVLYIRSALKKGTRPHAFTWGIWGLTGAILFLAQHAEGAKAGAWLQGGVVLCCFCVMGLGLTKYGDRRYARADWIALGLVLASVPLWLALGTPLWSVLLLCAMDVAGIVPTVRKSWSKPWEEPALPYALWMFCGILSLGATTEYSVSTVAPSVLIAVLNVSMSSLLMLRRAALRRKGARP
jgi:hypothetical protein